MATSPPASPAQFFKLASAYLRRPRRGFVRCWPLWAVAFLCCVVTAWAFHALPLQQVYQHCAASSRALTALRLGNYVRKVTAADKDALGELDAPYIFSQTHDVLAACGLFSGALPALFIDIGANLGETSVAMVGLCQAASARCSVRAFEPARPTFAKFRERAVQARWAGFEATLAAVSSTTGTQNFYFSGAPDDQQSSLSQSTAWGWKEVVVVNLTTVDALTRALAPHATPSFLKIDTEGFDAHVLLGAASTLQRTLFPFVLFEYNGKWRDAPGGTAENNLHRALQPLHGAGYFCFLLTPSGLVPLWDGFWSFQFEVYEWSNVLCGLREHKCTAPLVARLNSKAGIAEEVSAACLGI